MASSTRAVVGALTTRVSLMTWLTVAVETPARSATDRIVATRAPPARPCLVIVYVPDFAACYQGGEKAVKRSEWSNVCRFSSRDETRDRPCNDRLRLHHA